MTVIVDLREDEIQVLAENFLVCTETVKSMSVQRGWYIYQANNLDEAVARAKKDGLNPVYAVPLSMVSEVQKEKALLDRVFNGNRK